MRILLAEDDPDLGDGLKAGLQQLGFTVDWVRDGQAALAVYQGVDHFDAMVLDIGLPKLDGLQVLARLRQQQLDLPVLLLTARDAIEDRIHGLDGGADDYMSKPFDLHELVARLRAIIRRSGGRASSSIQHGQISLDQNAKQVLLNGEEVSLSAQEYAILEYLMTHVGQVKSKQQIESALYGWDEGVESNAIEVHVHHLRKKLGKELIKTVRGLGYSIRPVSGQ